MKISIKKITVTYYLWHYLLLHRETDQTIPIVTDATLT
jgi:hypothetical protein